MWLEEHMTASMNIIEPRTEQLDRCPMCHSPKSALLVSSPDRLHGVPGLFHYHKCEDCGSVFQNPRVIADDLHLCYPAEYDPYTYDSEMPDLDVGTRDLNKQISTKARIRSAVIAAVCQQEAAGAWGALGKFLAKSRLLRERAFFGVVRDECLPNRQSVDWALDIGCGAGWLMKRLAKVGWLVEGVEWNKDAADLAALRTGAKVYNGDVMSLGLETQKYQLIVLSHVIEHLFDPNAVIERIHDLLAPGGRAVLFLPNIESADSKYYKEFWFPLEAPRHINFPSASYLQKMAVRHGFAIARVRSTAADWAWKGSKAYQLRRHPYEFQGPLSVGERGRFQVSRIQNILGSPAGSELIAVLTKKKSET